MSKKTGSFTRLLKDFDSPDGKAREELARLVFQELRKLARGYLLRERASHTLQPTALVNEAFARLLEGETIDWESRVHFYKMAATMMRRVLVDHARARVAGKRGGKQVAVEFDENLHGKADTLPPDVVALDIALTRLAEKDPRLSQVVELRYFGGLELTEIAQVLDISVGTVKRDWVKARVWLYEQIKRAA